MNAQQGGQQRGKGGDSGGPSSEQKGLREEEPEIKNLMVLLLFHDLGKM